MRPLVATLLPLLAAIPGDAHACSTLAPGEFVVGDDPADTTPPTEIAGSVDVRVFRGVGPECPGPISGGSTCDGLGTILLQFAASVDGFPGSQDTAVGGGRVGEVGYRLEVAEGHVPEGFWLPEAPTGVFVDADGRATMPLGWGDGAEAQQESFSFRLRVTPVDAAGNRAPATLVLASHPGRDVDPSACDVASDGEESALGLCAVSPAAGSLAGLAAAAWAARMRRRGRGARNRGATRRE